MTKNVDEYFVVGCGRCSLTGTPQCKVMTWQEELQTLRTFLLEAGLTEESKWGSPCYTFEGNNVILLYSFKDYCAIAFFKGSLLSDKENILVAQTENVQAGRQIRFTNVQQVLEIENTLKAYIAEAIELEKSGAKVSFKPTSEFAFPEELENKFDENPTFKKAFYALTPGRQRGYLLHFTAAKQSATRSSRIEKMMPQIFAGKGLHD